MTVVELLGVSKRYGDAVALDRVDLSVPSGQLLALVGPSGCGKTTALRLIAGLDELSGGDIRFNGSSVVKLKPADRGLGMVFQADTLSPNLTVADNLSIGLSFQRRSKAEQRTAAAEVATRLGLESLLDRKPSQLSGGQRQRVAIGRVMARPPSVLLMDEPLSNLDGALRATLRLEVGITRREMGATTIYVTHDHAEALAMADKVAVLHDGAVRQVGTPAEVYEQPADTFVAAFMGVPPMNLLHLAGTDDIIGVRPHDIVIRPDPGAEVPGWLCHALVIGLEYEGRETLVHLLSADTTIVPSIVPGVKSVLTAVAPPDSDIRLSDRFPVLVPAHVAHRFEAMSGRRRATTL
jgi:multiple sugar transport system ATP-binding protein